MNDDQGTVRARHYDRTPDEDLKDTIWGRPYLPGKVIHEGPDHSVRVTSDNRREYRE